MTDNRMLRVVGDNGSHRLTGAPLGSALDWYLRISGEVEAPCTLPLSLLWSLPPSVTPDTEINCVSAGKIYRPGGARAKFAGVSLRTLAEHVGLRKDSRGVPLAKTVRFVSRAPGGCGPVDELHDTAVSLEHCLSQDKALLAASLDDHPLLYRNGGPLRSVVQDLYFYKSVKWLGEVQFLDLPLDACKGTWERYAGYHNRARVAKGERFEPFLHIANDQGKPEPVADTREAFELLLESGDLSRLVVAKLELVIPGFARDPRWTRDLRFVDLGADGRPRFQAKLRGSNFDRHDLRGWNLAHVNFSLSSFVDAQLTDDDEGNAADLRECDLEGAKFWAANLANVNMQGAILTGVRLFGQPPREHQQSLEIA